MKIKTTVEIYTTQESRIDVGTILEVDYFDDNKGLVWFKDPTLLAGEEAIRPYTYITLDCFINFCKNVDHI